MTMQQNEIRDLIVGLFQEKESHKNIGLDDDYFSLGVSSLTIIGLQIKVEEQLGVNVETRTLMGLSTINQWIDTYVARSREVLARA
jgi:acyl carrier protein